MFKALLKKQVLQTLSMFHVDNKKNARRSPWFTVLLIALVAYALVGTVAMMWMMAEPMCAPLVQAKLSWVYFALTGTMAFGSACVIVMFMAKGQLYDAKDNDLLLSMPIPAHMILCSRLIALYAFSFLIVALMFIPSVVCYYIVVGVSALSVVFSLLIVFILPFGVLAIGGLLAWILKQITARLPSDNLLTIIGLLAFCLLYAYGYNRIQDALNYILAHGEQVGETMKIALFPFWQMGLAVTGKAVPMVAFTAIFMAAFGLVYLLMSKTFFRMATMRKSGKRAVYKAQAMHSQSAFWALFKKEARRIIKSPMVLFNCCMGSILSILLIVYVAVDPKIMTDILSAQLPKTELGKIFSSIMFFMAGSNMLTASSISLEGETLWILRSMPVPTKTILRAKSTFHIVVTALPVGAVTAVGCIALGVDTLMTVLSVLGVVAMSVLCAALGLLINLKFPNLKWTNEVAAVKQSLSGLFAMFGGWAIAGLALGGSFWFGKYWQPWVYLSFEVAVFAVLSVVVWWALEKFGGRMFESLT